MQDVGQSDQAIVVQNQSFQLPTSEEKIIAAKWSLKNNNNEKFSAPRLTLKPYAHS